MNNWTKAKKAAVDAIVNELFDQGHTPHLRVFVAHPKFIGPGHMADEEGMVIFSLGLNAVRNYDVNEEGISFNAAFQGKPYFVDIPYESIAMVKAKDDDQLYFTFEVGVDEEETAPAPVAYLDKEAADEVLNGRNPKANMNWSASATVHQ